MRGKKVEGGICPMRTGTTSWIYHSEDIAGNVERLGGLVDDIELVLFDVKGYGNNLPTRSTIGRLDALAQKYGHSYTVHLPQDLLFTGGGTGNGSLERAREVIRLTRALKPWAYVAHLNGDALLEDPSPSAVARWREGARRALDRTIGWLERPELLAIENIERWDPEAFAPLVAEMPVSRCVDVGHLWLQGEDPLRHLDEWVDRTRVVHLHGLKVFTPMPRCAAFEPGMDHVSLARMPAAALDPVAALLERRFDGVVTLEVFSEEDLHMSRRAWEEALARVQAS